MWPRGDSAARPDGRQAAVIDVGSNSVRLVIYRVDGRALLEASGGVTLDNVRAIAETGVDWISVGALTHSVPAMDLGLDFTSV